jgi:pyridoxamine 5'-phosphate oxidase
MKKNIADLRKDYRLKTLNEEDISADPVEQFTLWWGEAVASEIEEVNAMTLATASKEGLPSARIVLLKGFNETGFIFFTNYNSYKGKQLQVNPKAALIFFWKELERQIRIEGKVEKITAKDSDEYFNSRPAGSRIGAWASPQSNIIENRAVIEENVKKYIDDFRQHIPRPPYWGGYIVKPDIIEFWQGRSNRLHDRIQYTKQNNGNWKIVRLAP